MTIAPLKLKKKSFYNELYRFSDNNTVIFIFNDDKELFRKCSEI